MHSMKAQRETVHQPPHVQQLVSLTPCEDVTSGYSGDEGVVSVSDDMYFSSAATNEESLHFAINWLTGVSNYNKRPFSTQHGML